MRQLQILVVALIVVGVAGSASAQTLEAPRARQGYWVAFGYGAELAAASNDGESLNLVGSGGALRLGQMLDPRFGLGVRIDFGAGTGDGLEASGGGLALEGQMDVWDDLAVHAGFGFGFQSLTDPDDPAAALVGGYGAVALLGVSYDWFFTGRTSGGWALTPALTVRGLSGGDVDGVWVNATLQISWWSGRPRNELELPEGAAYR